MKVLKRIWWLLTEAPISITEKVGPVECDICGSDCEDYRGSTTYKEQNFTICNNCMVEHYR